MREAHEGKENTGNGEGVSHLPEVLTVDEVAALLRVNRKTVYGAIKRAEIPGVRRIGGTIRVLKVGESDPRSECQGQDAANARRATRLTHARARRRRLSPPVSLGTIFAGINGAQVPVH